MNRVFVVKGSTLQWIDVSAARHIEGEVYLIF